MLRAESLVAEFRARPAGEPVLRALREAVLVVMDRTVAGRSGRVKGLVSGGWRPPR